MGEVKLDERFARFEARVAGTFRPAPLDEVAARARGRRRVRRGLLAGLLAALVAAPAGGFALAAGGDGRPSPLPPSPTGPSQFRPVERRVAVAGVDLPLRRMWFGPDARHGGAQFESCADPGDYTTCRHALAFTDDGGVTWRKANLPDLAADNRAVNVYPLDARTLAIRVIGRRFWLTTDGGRSFVPYPETSPPLAAQRANAGGDFTLLCDGATGFEDGGLATECDRPRLVKLGAGPVPAQPGLAGQLQQVRQGRDGRLWLVSWDGDRTRVAVSTDDARSWTEIGPVPGGSTPTWSAVLTVSPDGADVWLVADAQPQLWRLSGNRFVAQTGLPHAFSAHNLQAAGGGVLAMGFSGTAGFWQDGTFSPIEGLRADSVEVLPDGSVVFEHPDGGWTVGTGNGRDRTWLRFS